MVDFPNIKQYHKSEVAAQQLKVAVSLFLNKVDLSSVITLAGAAGNILTQLVKNAGQEPFIDYVRRVHNLRKKNTPSREKYKHFIDRILGVSAHKHMSDKDSEFIDLDLQQCAEDALLAAIADYVKLYGHHELFIKDFLQWSIREKGFDITDEDILMMKKLNNG